MGNAPGAARVFAESEGLLDEIPLLRGATQDGLEDWRERVEAVTRRTDAVLADIDAQLAQASRARREEFARRASLFNQTPERGSAGRAEEAPADPATFVRTEGLSAHEGPLLEILGLMRALQEAGAPRSGVQRCVQQWLRSTWGGGGTALQFSPAR